ncbi:hypothetical protein HK096_010837, partial [Nowakowskiella sp. JEL0078]
MVAVSFLFLLAGLAAAEVVPGVCHANPWPVFVCLSTAPSAPVMLLPQNSAAPFRFPPASSISASPTSQSASAFVSTANVPFSPSFVATPAAFSPSQPSLTSCSQADPQSTSQPLASRSPKPPKLDKFRPRNNYARSDCSAAILSTNTGAAGASSILKSDKDKYMLNLCSIKDKFVVIRLCDDIWIEEVHVANFEFFSSGFRDFRILVREGKDEEVWHEIGMFKVSCII